MQFCEQQRKQYDGGGNNTKMKINCIEVVVNFKLFFQ